MNDLIMLTGLPGCGKSTYGKPYGFRLSSDDYIEMIAERHGKTYNEMFESTVQCALAQLDVNMVEYINQGANMIIWDQTNLTAKARMKKLKQFNEAGGSHYRKISVFFEPDMTLCLARNEARRAFGRGIPLDVIERMAGDISLPSKSEGFDYVFVAPAETQV